MNIDRIQAVQELLAFALIKEKANLIDLLRRNGVNMPYDASDDDVLVATLNASVKSKYFKDELSKLLASMSIENAETFTAFDGDEGFFNLNAADAAKQTSDAITQSLIKTSQSFQSGTGTGTTTTGTGTTTKKRGEGLAKVGDWLKTNILTPDNINSFISTGLTAMNNKSQRKADNAAANLEQIRAEKAALEARGAGTETGAGAKKGGKTLLWVVVGVGVIALGFSIYFMVKNKGVKQGVKPA
jgi:hypothetical protein